ncbi:hypothetical protein JMUB5695_03019 [Mycobacterium heckeshornense]|uniref:Uncharacterized protein n=1 Tax=Mycobacterium heckeshornense TaxID=110505 RepID=A0A7R7TY86_9MYCO|nr:hypothetical protein MHEC_31130 [Mycobacterium heckeshornense]BCQ09574.1 hypothetical protein JMUB5695_03019 [Mycobacterium heckeshornense]
MLDAALRRRSTDCQALGATNGKSIAALPADASVRDCPLRSLVLAGIGPSARAVSISNRLPFGHDGAYRFGGCRCRRLSGDPGRCPVGCRGGGQSGHSAARDVRTRRRRRHRRADGERAVRQAVVAVETPDRPLTTKIEITRGSLLGASRSAAMIGVGTVGSYHFRLGRVSSRAAPLAVSAQQARMRIARLRVVTCWQYLACGSG